MIEIDLVPPDAVLPAGVQVELVVLPHSSHHFAGKIQVLGNESAMIVEQMGAHGDLPSSSVAVPKLLGCLTQEDSGVFPR